MLASLASTAFLFRYSGIALIPLGAIIVARYARPTRRIERCRLAIRFAVVASVVPVLLMLRNLSADSTLMGARSPSADSIISSLHMVASTIGRWATFEASETVAPNRLGVVIVSVVLVAAIWHSIVTPQSRVAPLAIYAVGYLASVVLAQVSTALDVIGSRLLSPLFVPFVLILSVQFSNVVRSRGVGWRGFRTVIAVTAAGSLLVASLSSLVDLSVRSSRHGIGFSTDGWRRSSLAHAAARLPSDSLIYSNQPGGLWVTVRREPILVAPERTAWRSDALKPISPGFLRDATCSQTYLAWFYDATSNLYEPEELRRPAKLERVSEHSDGLLYRSSGQPSATGC